MPIISWEIYTYHYKYLWIFRKEIPDVYNTRNRGLHLAGNFRTDIAIRKLGLLDLCSETFEKLETLHQQMDINHILIASICCQFSLEKRPSSIRLLWILNHVDNIVSHKKSFCLDHEFCLQLNGEFKDPLMDPIKSVEDFSRIRTGILKRTKSDLDLLCEETCSLYIPIGRTNSGTKRNVDVTISSHSDGNRSSFRWEHAKSLSNNPLIAT